MSRYRRHALNASILALLAGCGDGTDGGGARSCSGIDIQAVVQRYALSADLSVEVKNGTSEAKLVTAAAVDPSGRKWPVGPFRVQEKGSDPA